MGLFSRNSQYDDDLSLWLSGEDGMESRGKRSRGNLHGNPKVKGAGKHAGPKSARERRMEAKIKPKMKGK